MLVGTTVKSPGGTIEVAVLIGGVEQQLYRRAWDGKPFVIGPPGQAYTLRVKNLTTSRVEVVNTVDGRHTLDDEDGDYNRNRGLVIGALQAGPFSGWRINDDQTNQFVFTAPERSIAAQATGSKSNVGVIGFAAFREYPALRRRGGGTLGFDSEGGFESYGPTMRGTTRGGGLEAMGPARGGVGTGMGATQEDRVGRTTFNRNSGEPDILVIGYDTEEYLRSQGIIAPAEANPWPGVGKTGYAKYQTTR